MQNFSFYPFSAICTAALTADHWLDRVYLLLPAYSFSLFLDFSSIDLTGTENFYCLFFSDV